MDLLLRKVQRSLMVRPPRIDNHTMQCTALLDDFIHCRSDRRLLCHVRLEALELPGPPLLRGGKIVAWLGVVDGVDYLRTVVEAGLSDAEANAAVGAGDCVSLAITWRWGKKVEFRTGNDFAAERDLGLVLLLSWHRTGRGLLSGGRAHDVDGDWI